MQRLRHAYFLFENTQRVEDCGSVDPQRAHHCWWPAQEPSYFTGSDVRIRDPDLPTLQFAVAWKGAAYSDPDSIPLMVMQQMLGAWNKASGVDDTTASRAAFFHPLIANAV